MRVCSETGCGESPRKCCFAIEDYDGEAYWSGLPVRFYRPGMDCPYCGAGACRTDTGRDRATRHVRKNAALGNPQPGSFRDKAGEQVF